MRVKPWKTLSPNSLLSTTYVSVHSDVVELPNGNIHKRCGRVYELIQQDFNGG